MSYFTEVQNLAPDSLPKEAFLVPQSDSDTSSILQSILSIPLLELFAIQYLRVGK